VQCIYYLASSIWWRQYLVVKTVSSGEDEDEDGQQKTRPDQPRPDKQRRRHWIWLGPARVVAGWLGAVRAREWEGTGGLSYQNRRSNGRQEQQSERLAGCSAIWPSSSSSSSVPSSCLTRAWLLLSLLA
jgi:hypothetical protein